MPFWAYLYSVGTQHGNLHPAGWPILFCKPTQELVLDTANAGKKSGEVLQKMQVNGLEGRNKARKKFLTVSVACMAIYWPTQGFKRRTFKLRVLNRWDINFCVRSSPLRGCYRWRCLQGWSRTFGWIYNRWRHLQDWWGSWRCETSLPRAGHYQAQRRILIIDDVVCRAEQVGEEVGRRTSYSQSSSRIFGV